MAQIEELAAALRAGSHRDHDTARLGRRLAPGPLDAEAWLGPRMPPCCMAGPMCLWLRLPAATGFGMPRSSLDNDANVCRARRMDGSAPGAARDTWCIVTVSTGIGGGVIA